MPVTDKELAEALDARDQAHQEFNVADPDLIVAAAFKLSAAELRVRAALMRVRANVQHQKGA